jgi:hypothetical protein
LRVVRGTYEYEKRAYQTTNASWRPSIMLTWA